MHGEQIDKDLGTTLVGDSALLKNHPLRVVWAKFHKYKRIILNKHVSPKLRLKLFDLVVSYTATFGLAILQLMKVQVHKLDVVQRRMLRSIVGWVRIRNG